MPSQDVGPCVAYTVIAFMMCEPTRFLAMTASGTAAAVRIDQRRVLQNGGTVAERRLSSRYLLSRMSKVKAPLLREQRRS